jgi:hypothetical protein
MRKLLICVAAVGATLALATPVAAQYYPQPNGYNGYGYGGYGYNGYGDGGYGMQGRVQALCSGQRGYALESRLRHEESEGEIDPYAAARIHQAIDRLEYQQRHECEEGDWRSIARIGSRYDRIGQWIETAAHGYQPWDR